MRHFFVFFLFAISFNEVKSQSLVDSISNTGFSLNDSIAEKLSLLAMYNKKITVSDKAIAVSQQEVDKSKAMWFNNLAFNSNFNEFTINNTLQGQQNIFFPRYNINLNLPLGFFLTRPKEVRIAKYNLEKSVATKDMELEEIRQSIKIHYQLYLSNKYFLALHESMLQDQKILLDKVEASFENNQIDLEAFISATKSFNDILVKKINLIKDLNSSKFQLENLLGMKLEEAYKKIGL